MIKTKFNRKGYCLLENNKITDLTTLYNGEKRYSSICCFRNKDVTNHLNSFGILPNKSKTLNISKNLNWDFVRGVFDDDVYLERKKLKFDEIKKIIENGKD